MQEVGRRIGLWFFFGGRLKEEGERVRIRGHGEGRNIHFINSLEINLFSVFSVVAF
jgi:hypothetical protein